ncbi:MAG: RluA family pseudouridine synthase [Oscillospiraceae bacterium]|nr:RluA family pseudouridine synthase [Oscillospiraceae bacterium]
MNENIVLETGLEWVDKRIDVYVAQNTDYSRNSVQLLLEENKISVNGKNVSKSYKMKYGDILEITVEDAKDVGIEAENIPLDIYYEDKDLLVVNKPKGMVVHPANGNENGTLVNALMYHCKDSLSGINGEIRPGIVHRIDKDTSGLLVVAKNDIAHEHLAKQFKEHSINRIYYAIVYGNVKEDSGDIEAPIGRHKTDRKKFCITETNSKYAFTHYDVVDRLNGFTLVKLKLKTGRTHQIRVHMQSKGHPLAGDPVYGPKNCITELKGQALHAGVLGFIHPTTNEYIEFSSPWPIEFEKFYNSKKLKL